MQKPFTFYTNTGYWFLLFIPLVFFGFYPTYFAVFLRPFESIVHIHFVLMTIWVLILIVQPFLYKYKKLSLHRKIGRFTYFLVPILLVSAFLMMRSSFARAVDTLTSRELVYSLASSMSIAFLYFLWLALLYSLAIINKRPSAFHARYMVATALTVLGPTVDRIIWALFKQPKLGGWFPIEMIAFLIINITIATLLWKDHRHGRSTKALMTCLIIFVTGQILYFLVKGTTTWQQFVISVLS